MHACCVLTVRTAQIYVIRQAIAKALVAYMQKYVDEASKKEVKDIFARYNQTLLVADRLDGLAGGEDFIFYL
uniref:Uncharacterized protein n=1 Tax=Oryza brachyantha TaxID=4533 RepID=J3NCH0_ORYBR